MHYSLTYRVDELFHPTSSIQRVVWDYLLCGTHGQLLPVPCNILP